MKKTLVAMLLVATVTAVAQTAAPAQPATQQTTAPHTAAPQNATPAAGTPAATTPQQSAAPAAPQQKKEIKDPAEYNAYVGAVQQTDAAAKISGIEAFLAQYPNSVMKEDALELLMGTYQGAGNQAKVIDTANRLLAANPDNARALVLLAYNERPTQKWAGAKQHAERGLQAVTKMAKPDGVSDADFAKQKSQLT